MLSEVGAGMSASGDGCFPRSGDDAIHDFQFLFIWIILVSAGVRQIELSA
jgi:hypothetical protein